MSTRCRPSPRKQLVLTEALEAVTMGKRKGGEASPQDGEDRPRSGRRWQPPGQRGTRPALTSSPGEEGSPPWEEGREVLREGEPFNEVTCAPPWAPSPPGAARYLPGSTLMAFGAPLGLPHRGYHLPPTPRGTTCDGHELTRLLPSQAWAPRSRVLRLSLEWLRRPQVLGGP